MNWIRMVALCAVGLMGPLACGNDENGTNGTANGTNGANGTDGVNGVNGTNGTDGTNGTNGADNPDAGAPDAVASTDAGDTPDASAPDAQEPVDQATVPTSGFGTQTGSNFSPITLVSYCDGTEFDFYSNGSGYFDAKLTVLIRAAEWCGPCRAEATEIGQGELDEYGPKGVRFLTVMDQNQTGGAPSPAACESWEDAYGLDRSQIDHHMLMDPAQEVAVYFPPGQNGYPGNVIVDNKGQIRRRIIGFSQNLSSLKAALDELLEP